jgi:hypothetical protein
MTVKHHKAAKKAGWPLVVYFGMIGLGLLSYVIARIALDGSPHPIHWVSGLAGALVGFFAGWLWYRFRGDII